MVNFEEVAAAAVASGQARRRLELEEEAAKLQRHLSAMSAAQLAIDSVFHDAADFVRTRDARLDLLVHGVGGRGKPLRAVASGWFLTADGYTLFLCNDGRAESGVAALPRTLTSVKTVASLNFAFSKELIPLIDGETFGATAGRDSYSGNAGQLGAAEDVATQITVHSDEYRQSFTETVACRGIRGLAFDSSGTAWITRTNSDAKDTPLCSPLLEWLTRAAAERIAKR